MVRRVIRIVLWLVLVLVLAMAALAFLNRDLIRRTMLGGLKVYETVPPALPAVLPRPAMLVFSKTNGFRHVEAIPAADRLLAGIARDHGWGYFQTENGAAFSPEILARFDLVVFNSASGDLFTPPQRAAFRAFIEQGGGFVGLHAAGDSSHAAWPWYVDNVIGAHFVGHPLGPQFQWGHVRVADQTHPATRALPQDWRREDEWYFFKAPPKAPFHVLARLDEASIPNHKAFFRDLSMGADHPIAWWRCLGRGRVFYSAMGHMPQAYSDPLDAGFLRGAVEWAMLSHAQGCAEGALPVP